jgi:hypothetical protein
VIFFLLLLLFFFSFFLLFFFLILLRHPELKKTVFTLGASTCAQSAHSMSENEVYDLIQTQEREGRSSVFFLHFPGDDFCLSTPASSFRAPGEAPQGRRSQEGAEAERVVFFLKGREQGEREREREHLRRGPCFFFFFPLLMINSSTSVPPPSFLCRLIYTRQAKERRHSFLQMPNDKERDEVKT